MAGRPQGSKRAEPGVVLLYVIVFVGALTTIGVEITPSRLVGPYFGNSTFIWANLIGLTLTYLSVGAFYGSLVGVILLFFVPITLLGCVSPLAIRLRLRGVEEAGGTAGALYALSTIGSIAGSFLPVLVLIPYLGARQTFYAFAAALAAIALIGFLRDRAI